MHLLRKKLQILKIFLELSGILDRDTGFCSAAEDDLDTDLQSPTDASEDSVEVKVRPISLKNKRKCVEPRRVGDDAKKRVLESDNPFRPWNQVNNQDQPLSLVLRDKSVMGDRPQEVVRLEDRRDFSVDSLLNSGRRRQQQQQQQHQQRNYKNMTRERRIEANARERTRVHTISAAFDTLRRAVPAYSHNQKLSKLSVLRIACSYILTLSRVAGHDYSADQSAPSLSDCVDNVSKTIQMEGKLRKKKEDC
ncbi:atonal bHLH transcription factor 8-like protein net isoform X2 [Lycorma delicatula]|uniref:atonal bHLH transcription factor 8-like protein net isoform X2 n=1 Tax=Lycorma delicatula TaxID=130591 RepID=UPI003F517D86